MANRGGRRAMGLLVMILAVGCMGDDEPPRPSYWPTESWRSRPPDVLGFDSSKLADGLQAVAARGTRIHSLTLVRHGALALDAVFYPYDGSMYHDLGSVTKSVITTLLGIAADQGKVDLDRTVLSYFPDRTVANRDPWKERITVRHLASLTAGLECNPADDESKLDEMRASADWVQFALDRRAVREPGTRFVYSGLEMHLLSAILQRVTGRTALVYAREYLFEPLGIHDVSWPTDPQGITRGWGDLSLRPEDAAKIGYLFLQKGRWAGRQLVSRQWVDQATTRQARTDAPRAEDYGYGWWVSRERAKIPYFAADGRNGQRILVVPSLDLVAVTTGGGAGFPSVESCVVGALSPAKTADPAALARLDAVLASLRAPPAAKAPAAIPEAARALSGRTFVMDPNPIGLRSVRLVFAEPDEAVMEMDLLGEPLRRFGVGLDEIPRTTLSGRPVLARGRWTERGGLTVELDEGPGMQWYILDLRLEGDTLVLSAPGFERLVGRAATQEAAVP